MKDAREALAELGRATQRNVGKRALASAARVHAELLASAAPVSTDPSNRTIGSLRASIVAKDARASRGRPRKAVVIEDVAAVPTEFGTRKMAARPWARSATDRGRGQIAEAFGAALKDEIDAAAARAARRAARAAKG